MKGDDIGGIWLWVESGERLLSFVLSCSGHSLFAYRTVLRVFQIDLGHRVTKEQVYIGRATDPGPTVIREPALLHASPPLQVLSVVNNKVLIVLVTVWDLSYHIWMTSQRFDKAPSVEEAAFVRYIVPTLRMGLHVDVDRDVTDIKERIWRRDR